MFVGNDGGSLYEDSPLGSLHQPAIEKDPIAAGPKGAAVVVMRLSTPNGHVLQLTLDGAMSQEELTCCFQLLTDNIPKLVDACRKASNKDNF